LPECQPWRRNEQRIDILRDRDVFHSGIDVGTDSAPSGPNSPVITFFSAERGECSADEPNSSRAARHHYLHANAAIL